jgi:hypothetical protein
MVRTKKILPLWKLAFFIFAVATSPAFHIGASWGRPSPFLTARDLKILVAAGAQRYSSVVYSGTVLSYSELPAGPEFGTLETNLRMRVTWTPLRELCNSKLRMRLTDGSYVAAKEGFLFNRTFTKSYIILYPHLGEPQISKVGEIWHGYMSRCPVLPLLLWARWIWSPISNRNSNVRWDRDISQYVVTRSVPTSTGAAYYVAYVSPAMGFLPTRYEVTLPNKAHPRWVINFSHFKRFSRRLWFPRLCVDTTFASANSTVADSLGPRRILYRLSVVRLNTPVPGRIFRLDFPANTVVTDSIMDTIYRTPAAVISGVENPIEEFAVKGILQSEKSHEPRAGLKIVVHPTSRPEPLASASRVTHALPYGWLAGAALVVFLLLFIMLLLRRKQNL